MNQSPWDRPSNDTSAPPSQQQLFPAGGEPTQQVQSRPASPYAASTGPARPDSADHGDPSQPVFVAPPSVQQAWAQGGWPQPQAQPVTAQPSSTQPPVAAAPRKQRMLPALVVVAMLSAGIGGGAALGVNSLIANQTPAVAAPAGPGVTRVVQGTSSAPDWAVTAAEASKSAVSIQVTSGQGGANGSGVVLDVQGHIVTNNHVASAAGANATITVQIGDRQYAASIVGTDPTSDLAVIKLANPPSGLVPIPFANSDEVKVGDPVMAIGNPLGLSGTVTTGIVSALNRPVTTTDGNNAIVTNAIQTSAAINPGNSGGALVNANGQLIGINSAIASLGASRGSQSGNIGIGFAIEANLVKAITGQIVSTGSANHAWLGVSAKTATATVGGSAIVGAEITRVEQSSPAAQVGLREGDLVTSVSGKTVTSLESLVAIVRAQRIEGTVEIGLVRGGAQQTLTVKLAASPK